MANYTQKILFLALFIVFDHGQRVVSNAFCIKVDRSVRGVEEGIELNQTIYDDGKYRNVLQRLLDTEL